MAQQVPLASGNTLIGVKSYLWLGQQHIALLLFCCPLNKTENERGKGGNWALIHVWDPVSWKLT